MSAIVLLRVFLLSLLVGLLVMLSGCAVAINIGNVTQAPASLFPQQDPLQGVRACRPNENR